MDKLTRYNQKLLAIIGTAVLITVSISILIGLSVFIFTIYDDFDGAAGIRLQNQAQIVGDTLEYKRLQEITFDTPYQIDTNKALFLIPVGLVNLESEKKKP